MAVGQCKKRRYNTEKEARMALMLCWATPRWKGKRNMRMERSFYWCAKCEAYHLTSKPPDNRFRRV